MRFLKSLGLILCLSACQKEAESDQVLISATGKCAFSVQFDRIDGYRHTVSFDCSYATCLPVQIPQGAYNVSAYTPGCDTLRLDFIKTCHWQELEVDW